MSGSLGVVFSSIQSTHPTELVGMSRFPRSFCFIPEISCFLGRFPAYTIPPVIFSSLTSFKMIEKTLVPKDELVLSCSPVFFMPSCPNFKPKTFVCQNLMLYQFPKKLIPYCSDLTLLQLSNQKFSSVCRPLLLLRPNDFANFSSSFVCTFS